GGPGTWVLALPTHYVAGLMVIARSVTADRPVLEVDPRLRHLPELDLGRGPAYLSLVPTQLTRALDDPELTRVLRRFEAVLLGGAAAEPRLLERSTAAGVRIVTTYGMSETCGGCVYDGRALADVSVTLDGAGRITLGGPTLFSGYRLDAAATAEALVGGRLLTRDRGRLDDGRLTVLGRLDDVVISGGLNVDLAAVERAVRAWAGSEAAVIGVPHPEWGTEVVAVLETEPDHPQVGAPEGASSASATPRGRLSSTDLRAALADRLPAHALPRRLVICSSLPRTSGGKIDRRRLIADLTPRPESR
ncbi:MAG TPA: AMP-binding protein, partial [Microlunatus sp.]|nr:AMP-binding protein [Microlunatus sp.]